MDMVSTVVVTVNTENSNSLQSGVMDHTCNTQKSGGWGRTNAVSSKAAQATQWGPSSVSHASFGLRMVCTQAQTVETLLWCPSMTPKFFPVLVERCFLSKGCQTVAECVIANYHATVTLNNQYTWIVSKLLIYDVNQSDKESENKDFFQSRVLAMSWVLTSVLRQRALASTIL